MRRHLQSIAWSPPDADAATDLIDAPIQDLSVSVSKVPYPGDKNVAQFTDTYIDF